MLAWVYGNSDRPSESIPIFPQSPPTPLQTPPLGTPLSPTPTPLTEYQLPKYKRRNVPPPLNLTQPRSIATLLDQLSPDPTDVDGVDLDPTSDDESEDDQDTGSDVRVRFNAYKRTVAVHRIIAIVSLTAAWANPHDHASQMLASLCPVFTLLQFI